VVVVVVVAVAVVVVEFVVVVVVVFVVVIVVVVALASNSIMTSTMIKMIILKSAYVSILDTAHVTVLQKNTTLCLLQQNFINPTCTGLDRC
jgi:hypothetical protein